MKPLDVLQEAKIKYQLFIVVAQRWGIASKISSHNLKLFSASARNSQINHSTAFHQVEFADARVKEQ